ncbi:hypothetical protein GCM10009117_08890 [Gangjinia marincola]|uniref:Outer membrane lipoprotein-sorting protein n=1 Tax=Gangjinia marincola TaxID=578463 RepID=A0ABP3XTR3_9FLAO
MKRIQQLLFIAAITIGFTTNAQTADEIVENYFENTGGEEAWQNIEAMRLTGKAGMGPQEFPFVQTVTDEGKMAIVVDLQGQQFVPQAFDGEMMWTTNFQSMEAEAADKETSDNFKQEAQDMIDTFLNYKEKGYSLELMGEETVEGTEAFKIKVLKKPVMVDGKEVENFSTFYFDKENFVPIMSEQTVKMGPQKGMQTQTIFSDYQEAGDIYYPYSITQKFNGQVGQTIKIEKIEINPDIDEAMFKMPVKE